MKRSTGASRIAQQDLRPLDVRGDELGGSVLDRLLNVRLGGRVHDHVDARYDVPHESRVADVAVHVGQALVAKEIGDVLEVPRVGQGVDVHHLVRSLGEQMADEVRRDEPAAAGDEYALGSHSRPESSPLLSEAAAAAPGSAELALDRVEGPAFDVSLDAAEVLADEGQDEALDPQDTEDEGAEKELARKYRARPR